jgi:glycosyltransferase involved in cell wall biosynthesis
MAQSSFKSDIHVMNDVPEEGLPDLYRTAAVFVQASFEEGLGLASMEAMASGLPVVCTETAGSETLIDHGRNGILVPQGPEVFVAKHLARGISAALSERGEAMGAAARLTAIDRFAATTALDSFEAAYRRAGVIVGGSSG